MSTSLMTEAQIISNRQSQSSVEVFMPKTTSPQSQLVLTNSSDLDHISIVDSR